MSAIDRDAAHRHCGRHRAELETSATCGCFYCGAIFPPDEIADWIDTRNSRDEWSARCPKCGIDAVLGDASGYPIEMAFLDAMHARWFERTLPHAEVAKRFRSRQ